MSENEPPFDYGKKRADGQYDRHPSKVLRDYVAPIRDEYVHDKCGTVTMMPQESLQMTYATNPSFYGRTFCVHCHDYFPVHEFRWLERGEFTEIRLGQLGGEPGKDLRHLSHG